MEKQTGYPEVTVIIISVDYADMLANTLPQVKKFFKNAYVLTSLDDEATVKVCQENDCSYVKLNLWQAGGTTFNKSGAINLAMTQLNARFGLDWVLYLDGDIYLQDDFELDVASLKRQSLYSLERRMCETEEDWNDFKSGKKKAEDFPYSDSLKMENGWVWGRFFSSNPAGWIGYFHLWNYKDNEWARAMPQTKSAAYLDVHFASKFGEAHRHYLPTSEVIHLGEERQNWDGRVTEYWGNLAK